MGPVVRVLSADPPCATSSFGIAALFLHEEKGPSAPSTNAAATMMIIFCFAGRFGFTCTCV
jgi:hypothetical protein